MKNKLLAIFALLLVPVVAFASLDSGNMNGEYRTFQLFIPFYYTPAAADVTAGQGGAIYASTNTAVTSLDVTDQATIYPMPYPSKLWVDIIDSDADSTPVCSSFKMIGTDQFGNQVTDTSFNGVTESTTSSASANVFEKVDRIVATCTGFDADDDIVIRMTEHVGLPLKVSFPSLVFQVCNIEYATDTNYTCHDVAVGDGVRVFGHYRVDTKANSINLDGLFNAIPEGDMVMVRGRASIR